VSAHPISTHRSSTLSSPRGGGADSGCPTATAPSGSQVAGSASSARTTSAAKIVEGRVEMVRNFALEPDELAAGYVLTCQSSPVTPTLAVDYDA